MTQTAAPRSNAFHHKGGWWVVGQTVLLLEFVAAGVMDRAATPSWSFHGGLCLFALGGVIGITGVAHLGGNRTPYPRPQDDAQLVTSGIYGWMRHPLYTCLVLASLGWSGIFHSRAALIATALLTVFLFAKARREERWLHEQFSDYATYQQRVAAFIPGLF